MISIIAAIDSKRGLGKNNQLLFKIKEDFVRMKKLTTGHPIIMGRKTFESIGRPLPNRTNIVITRDEGYSQEGIKVAHSLKKAIELAKNEPGGKEIFIFGGGQIFKEALPMVDKLYLTVVEGDYGADTFFPEYENLFSKKTFEQSGQEGKYRYVFIELER